VSLNNYITIDLGDRLKGKSWSVGGFFNRGRNGVSECLFSMGEQVTRGAINVYFYSDGKVGLDFGNDKTITTNAYTSDAGSFVHWMAVFDAATLTRSIYRNGVAVAHSSPTAGGTTSASGTMYIGAYKWGLSNYPFQGHLDNIVIYSETALDAAGVGRLSGLEGFPATGFLVVAFTFDSPTALGQNFAPCTGTVGDAAVQSGVVAVEGKECGATCIVCSSSGVACKGYTGGGPFLPCARGFFKDVTGPSACQSCPAAKYSADTAQTAQTACIE
jgi:hypothetical protein